MKKDALGSIAFPVMWAAYCAWVLVDDATRRTPAGFLGLVVGCLFLYGVGFLLLRLLGGRGIAPRWLVLWGAALALADQLAKALVLHFLPGGQSLALAGGWLAIRQIPNYSNNVIFSLLGIVLPPAAMGLFKFIIIAGVTVGLVLYCQKKRYPIAANARFGVACMFIGAAALCSLAETVYRGYILDFIGFAGLVGFDLKDIYLMLGAGLVIVVFLQWERDAEKNARAGRAAQGPPETLAKNKVGPAGRGAAHAEREGDSMKIAIPYEDGAIFQHFGKTSQFKLYSAQGGSLGPGVVLDTAGSGHGALAQLLQGWGVDVVICGGIGGGARQALGAAAIAIYAGVQGQADDAAQALVDGTLQHDPAFTCDHHGHEHGEEGHQCCGHHHAH